ncbi:hypothetical protein [Bradyrhizobium ganzhouense]|uniref:hypothetical protein n=1 Tax=Bradyrhizobium ganzhouense TaxID=1179767 RepID=UPI003CF72C11
MADQTFVNAPVQLRKRPLITHEMSSTSTGLVCTPDGEVRKIVDAIAATVANAQAGLNWLRARPLDLDEVQQALLSIANDGSRACEMVIRLRNHMNEDTLRGCEPAGFEASRDASSAQVIE